MSSPARSIYGHVDFLGTGPLSSSEEDKLRQSESKHPDQFLVFSDLHLDSPKDLSNFRNVLQAYESHFEERPPAVCILCGNFTAKPVTITDGKALKAYQGEREAFLAINSTLLNTFAWMLKACFSSFADLLLSYPRCARDTHFIFVPGPSDPFDVSNLLLPRRALPNSLVKDVKLKLPKVTFASNPCRILYKSQEIVVFRDDLMSRMLRNTVRLKSDLSSLANEQLQEEMGEEELRKWGDTATAAARKQVLSRFVSHVIHLAPFWDLTLKCCP